MVLMRDFAEFACGSLPHLSTLGQKRRECNHGVTPWTGGAGKSLEVGRMVKKHVENNCLTLASSQCPIECRCTGSLGTLSR